MPATSTMASAGATDPCWTTVDWVDQTRRVRRIQAKIVQAWKEGDSAKVRDFQRLLLDSQAARLSAVREVTARRGGRIAGVDGVTWETPEQKMRAVASLVLAGYRPLPLKKSHQRCGAVPTLQDRAFQALWCMALEPILRSEGLARDQVMLRCCQVFRTAPEESWILQATLQKTCPEVHHGWLLKWVPMHRGVLHRWLQAGHLDAPVTTPGASLFPLLASYTLLGLERGIRARLAAEGSSTRSPRGQEITLLGYPPEVLLTADSAACLENRGKPLLVEFLAERGLRLGPGCRIFPIREGCTLGLWQLRKTGQQLCIEPSAPSVRELMEKVEGILARHKTTRTDELIARLNPILQEWSSSQGVIPLHQQALRAIDRKLYEKIWRWARRRHRNKTQQWILDTYFPPQGDNHQRWLCGDTRRLWRLSGDPGVRRQEGIKGALAAHDA